MMIENRIRPIRTEQDYDAALARVEMLMEVVRTEEEDDELDVLATLIELYEDVHFPVDAPEPIAAIKFRMEQLGKSQSDLVPILGSRSKVSEVLSGKRELTLKMIRALHEHLKIPAEVLIREGGTLPASDADIDFDRYPLREMAKLDWISSVSDIKDRAEEIVLGLIDRAGGRNDLPQALFRQGGARSNAKMDVHALQAWCLHVLGEARVVGLENRHRKGSITFEFLEEVARLSTFREGPKLAREKLAQHGIALVVAPHLSKTYLDGAALWTKEQVPVVGMTIRYDRLDNFWFCLLHELAHLGLHFPNAGSDGEVFIDDLQLRERDHAVDDAREREADEWAQNALIPPALWSDHPARLQPSVTNVVDLAHQAKVHPSVVAGRIRYERHSYRLLSQFVGANEVRPLLLTEAT